MLNKIPMIIAIIIICLAIMSFFTPSQGECGIPSGPCIINGTEMDHYCLYYPECMQDWENANCTWTSSWIQKLKCP